MSDNPCGRGVTGSTPAIQAGGAGSSPADRSPASLPLGWDETQLGAYRDGYTDALLWALEHEHHEIEAVLDDPE